jgi:spore coat protein CotF
MADFSIENLASGNYNLIIEARDQKNELVATQKLFLHRSNPNAKLTYDEVLSTSGANSFAEKITNMDTLKEDISCTFPIS